MKTALPPRIDRDIRTGLVPTHALNLAATWVESGREDILVLEGHTGSGKSVAAAWAFSWASHRARHSATGQRLDPLWCDAPSLAQIAPWSDDLQRLDSAPLVVIDDVGTEEKPDRMRSILERLYNVGGARVVITTNLAAPDFVALYGERVHSRLLLAARWELCAGPDMRVDRPSGDRFPDPRDPTIRERDAMRLAEEQRKRDDEEWERTRGAREAAFGALMKRIDALGGEKRLRVASTGETDDEARERIRKQIEQRRQEGA